MAFAPPMIQLVTLILIAAYMGVLSLPWVLAVGFVYLLLVFLAG